MGSGGNSDSAVALSGSTSSAAMREVSRMMRDQQQQQQFNAGGGAMAQSPDISEQYLDATKKQSEMDRIREMIKAIGSGGGDGGYVG